MRDAKLTLAVQSVPTTFQDIRSAISGWGGYLANSDFRREPLDNQQATLQIRVPSEALDKVLAKLALMGRVVNQAESGQDVTDAYVDLESQLRNLRMAEQRLLQLMEKTGSVKDLLEVQTQVTETRGRIETIQGQLKAMDNKVSFATVDIQLQERQPIASEKFWNLGETFHDAQSMFMELLRAVITLSIYILFLIPFALPFVLFSWVWYRKSRRQRHTANAGEPKFTPRRAAESEPRVGADPGDAH